LLQLLKRDYSDAQIDIVVIPKAAELLTDHPSLSNTLVYDKRKKDKGLRGFLQLRSRLARENYDCVIVPHRSIRSALLARTIGAKRTIGFDKSSGSRLFTNVVHYDPTRHEIDRNLSLLQPLSLDIPADELPKLFPSKTDQDVINGFWKEAKIRKKDKVVAVAPGTVWNTKRWPVERFVSVCQELCANGRFVFLLGGKEDHLWCDEIAAQVPGGQIKNLAGTLSLLQSAELIRRCQVLLTNDSAPLHLGVAMETPVVAIFGATIPEFGFAPRGHGDMILETKGLKCRPCAIHGGKKCPIGSFDCMLSISSQLAVTTVESLLKTK